MNHAEFQRLVESEAIDTEAASAIEKEWATKSRPRIVDVLREAKRISMRELQRRTNYNRGPIGGWFAALFALEDAGEVRFESASGQPADAYAEAGVRVWAIYKKGGVIKA
jgi:hypothetical protein